MAALSAAIQVARWGWGRDEVRTAAVGRQHLLPPRIEHRASLALLLNLCPLRFRDQPVALYHAHIYALRYILAPVLLAGEQPNQFRIVLDRRVHGVLLILRPAW